MAGMIHAVIIPSVGRAAILDDVVRSLSTQTVQPDRVLVVVSADEDVPNQRDWPGVEVIYSERGASRQRNAGIDALDDNVDLVTFLDDDIELHPEYIARSQEFSVARPDVVLFSGHLLADGAVSGQISRQEARVMLAAWSPQLGVRDWPRAYGCNMTARGAVAKVVRFDERLPLYSLFEDRDFSVRATRYGKITHTLGAGAVHLATKTGRVSERRLGFSQTVNSHYLWRKRTLTTREFVALWTRILLANLGGWIGRDRNADRKGRFLGNLMGVREVLFRGGRPEAVQNLS
jgi:glycosyltransferase involved in cell wall biosynthesis